MNHDKSSNHLDDLSTGTSDDDSVAPVLAAAISRAKSFSASASASNTPAKRDLSPPPLRQLNETDDAPTLSDEFPVRGFSAGQRLMEAIRSSIGASTFDALESAWSGGKAAREKQPSPQPINVSNYAKHASQEAEQRLKHMLIMPNAITVRLLSASVFLLVVTSLGGFVITSTLR